MCTCSDRPVVEGAVVLGLGALGLGALGLGALQIHAVDGAADHGGGALSRGLGPGGRVRNVGAHGHSRGGLGPVRLGRQRNALHWTAGALDHKTVNIHNRTHW